ncbi:MAG: glycoside hydrolase family 3 N-terminal domain-containing protein [Candidatus Acetothermia bacterium]
MSSDLDKKIQDLLPDMTIEEKVAQLDSVMPDDLLEVGKFSEEKARKQLSDGIGQITRAGGGSGLHPEEAAELANKVQNFLEEETRLGIPAILHEECLSGYMGAGGTTYPQAIGLASSWQPELVKEITTEIRKQLTAIGTHHALSPVLDVARDLRWGRLEETFGEDPYLVASMGKNYVEGLQGPDPTEGIYATVKHFGGHSASEGGRNHCPVNLTERELRENFLFPFEVAVREADAEAVMNAYHDIDGVPCACSKELLTNLLRGEWGFGGIVVSDYYSIRMLHTEHHVARNKQEAGVMALEAGLDVELPLTECYGDKLVDAIEEGKASEAALDEAVKRHLKAKRKKGLFEGSNTVDVNEVNEYFETPEQRKLARKAARESMVLLKNEDGLLPLNKDQDSIAVIGPSADNTRNLLGDYAYSVHVESEEDTIPVTTILDGVKDATPEATQINYVKGCEVRGDSKKGFDSAVEAAEQSDIAVVAVGGKSGLGLVDAEEQKQDYPHTTGEGSDRTDLKLPGVQRELLQQIHETGTPIVAVLINGRPLSVTWLEENVPGIVECWLPGEEGGNAVADVLFGDYNPGGKLPVTIPKNVGQSPLHYRRKPISKNRHYVFTVNEPLYPFGYGLSYTDFEYSDFRITPEEVSSASSLEVSCTVKNTGDVRGKEVVQLYTRDKYASMTRPERELKGFEKVELEPDQEKRITFSIPTDLLSFYDKDMNLVIEPGSFKAMVGSSSQDIRLEGEFEITGKKKELGYSRNYFTKIEVEAEPS